MIFGLRQVLQVRSENDSLAIGALMRSSCPLTQTSRSIVSITARVRQAMELEFAFFDSQIQGSPEDGKLKQFTRTHMAPLQSSSVESSSVQTRSEGASDHEHFCGVHQRVALLCVDFDDTLTDGDTTNLLVEAAKAQVRFECSAAAVSRLWTPIVLRCLEPLWADRRIAFGNFFLSVSLRGVFGCELARGSGTRLKTSQPLNVSGRS